MQPATPGSLTELSVRAWVGDGPFQRAIEYAQEEAIFDARRQGATLRARCEGHSAESYNVHARIASGEVAGAGCTCPVGADGRCKHVGAILLTWMRRPGDFVVVEDTDRALGRRSRAELIAVIKQMIRQQPDLETLLVTSLPDGRARTPRTLPEGASPRMYRRQADAVFRRNGTEWGAVVPVVAELEATRSIGDGFLAQSDAASALAVYEGLVDAVLDRYAEYERQDEDSLLRHVVTECVEAIGRCMEAPGCDPSVRERCLRALFEVLDSDDNLGDMGPATEVPDTILRYADAGERALVARWVRSLAPEGSSWHSRPHAGFLLDLEAGTLEDEEFLSACVALGRDAERVERLLERGRTEEARRAASQAFTGSLSAVAEVLCAHGHEATAEEIVRDRASSVSDVGLFDWLLARARSTGDRASMARWAEALLVASPSIDRWRALRSLASPWEECRERVLVALDERAKTVAVEGLLDEGDIARALPRVADLPTVDASGRTLAGSVRLRVAEAAERSHPRDAVGIWVKHIDDLIATGRRTQYREAVSAVRRVCALHDSLGDHAGGSAWLAALKLRFSRLRALREEFGAVGL